MRNVMNKWNFTYGEIEKTHQSKKEFFNNKL